MRLIMRPPGAAFRRALSQHPERDRIDPVHAARQHAAYVAAIESAGVAVVALPPDDELPDACFTWDTVLAFPVPGDTATALLVACRPGEASRRPEVPSVLACAQMLAANAEVLVIQEPGTLDGGDVITYGSRVAIGVSARTNEHGAHQLADAVRRIGYAALLCPVLDRLHLASAVTALGPRRLIGTKEGFASIEAAGDDALSGIERLLINDEDLPAANVLAAGGRCFVAAGYPAAEAVMRGAGESVVAVDLEEFLRADGGPTCLVAPIY